MIYPLNFKSFTSFYLLPIMSLILIGCEDNTVSMVSPRSCDTIECPLGEICTTDSIGQAYCAPEIPLSPTEGSPSSVEGGMNAQPNQNGGAPPPTGGTPTPVGGGMEVGGQIMNMGGTESNGGMTANPTLGGQEGGEEMTLCSDIRLSLKPSSGSLSRVMLVVDRSSSMYMSGQDRWTPMKEALASVTEALEGQVQFGLTFFPNPTSLPQRDATIMSKCQQSGRNIYACEEAHDACQPGSVWIEPAFSTSQAIIQAMDDWIPPEGLGTPTASGLEAAYAYFMENPQSGTDLVLLATDGAPGCNFDLNPNTCTCLNSACELFGTTEMCLDEVSALGAVETLSNSSIKTLVLGLALDLPSEGPCINGSICSLGGQACESGTCVNQMPRILDELAVMGQTAIGGRHTEVGDLNQLQASLASVAGRAVPCRYDLETLEPYVDSVQITVDGQVVMRDPNRQNGWDYFDGALEFFGAACAELRDGQRHNLEASCR